MAQTADVIVIGAGVIGAAVAYELAKQGRKVLSLDANGVAGHGSTAGSCAIIRVHYSTLEGCAMAYEGFHDWDGWRDYLGAPEGETLAEFRQTGCLVMKTDANGHLTKHMEMSDALGCPYEEWSAEEITERLPIYRMDRFSPAKRMDDPAFGEPTGGTLKGRRLLAHGGLRDRPRAVGPEHRGGGGAGGRDVPLPCRGDGDPDRGRAASRACA
jgi:sarcosine oxidase subunit beta